MLTDRAFVSTVKYHGIEEDHKLSIEGGRVEHLHCP